MDDVTLRDVDLDGLPAIRLEGGGLVATIVPSMGGRVASFKVDGLDLFWREPRFGTWPNARAALPHPIWWGGWKTWIAPQSAWREGLPSPELDEGEYDVQRPATPSEAPFVHVTSPVCPASGLVISRRISLDPAKRILTVHVEVTNRAGAGPLEVGIWEVIQLRRPVVVSFPVDPKGIAPKQGGVATYEREGDSVAARADVLRIINDAAGRRAEVRCHEARRFKYGARVPAGRGSIRGAMGQLGRSVKLRFDAPAGARYAHDASVEVYNSAEAEYCELEAHAPIARLEPGGQAMAHTFRLEAPVTKGRQ